VAAIRIKSFASRWGPAILVMVLIFLISSIPMKIYPPSTKPWKPTWDFVFKKGGHLLGYALLGMTVQHGLGMRGWKFFIITLGFSFIFAMTDEFHQSFIPGRSAKWSDVGIDLIGAAIGLWIEKHEKIRLLLNNPGNE
jgi:VanZ family protein